MIGPLTLERSGGAKLPLGVDGNRAAVLAGDTDVVIVDDARSARWGVDAASPRGMGVTRAF